MPHIINNIQSGTNIPLLGRTHLFAVILHVPEGIFIGIYHNKVVMVDGDFTPKVHVLGQVIYLGVRV